MITIKDIAEKAGVSIGTVDRVLHNRKRVAPDTVKKIQEIIKKHGYTANVFARQLSLAKQFSFGVLMPKLFQDSAYWELPATGINRAAMELASSRIRIDYFLYDKFSTDSFIKQTEKIKKADLDGIVIAPLSSDTTKHFVDAIASQIPCVFIDSEIPDTRALTSIYQDAFQSGVLAAKLMLMAIKTKGSIAIVRDFPDMYHINERIRGFKSYSKTSSHLQVRTYDIHDAKEKSFEQIAATIFNDNCDLRGIFVTNANTHLIAEQVKNHGKENKVLLIGYDFIQKNRFYLENGMIDFIISQQPAAQGYQGIYCLYRKVVLKQTCENKIMMPLDIITKENCTYYYN